MPFVKKSINESIFEDERNQARDCPHLLLQLENADPMIRRWAARDLIDCPNVSAALVARLKQEHEISVREIILSTLTVVADEVAISGLVECLRSEDAALRNEAIAVMQQLPDEISQIIPSLLSDPDPDVRIFTVNILESLCHPNVEAWLISVIEQDNVVNVCASALDLLVEVGSKSAEVPLKNLKERFSNEPYIQFAVDLALKRISEY